MTTPLASEDNPRQRIDSYAHHWMSPEARAYINQVSVAVHYKK